MDLELSDISISRLMQKVQKMVPDYDNKIKIIDEIPDVIINADELKMALAIRNLLDNAIKYSSASTKPCEVSFRVDNHLLFIAVKDFGQGIKKEDISKLTEPFYRANSETNIKGFGIGLTIGKKVIKSHNGELIIDSKYGKESTFTLRIPCRIKK